jgi:hypothetical protein
LNAPPIPSSQSSVATLWHVRISVSALQYFRPGASPHAFSTQPRTSRALHVPQVPVAHSYDSSTP